MQSWYIVAVAELNVRESQSEAVFHIIGGMQNVRLILIGFHTHNWGVQSPPGNAVQRPRPAAHLFRKIRKIKNHLWKKINEKDVKNINEDFVQVQIEILSLLIFLNPQKQKWGRQVQTKINTILKSKIERLRSSFSH